MITLPKFLYGRARIGRDPWRFCFGSQESTHVLELASIIPPEGISSGSASSKNSENQGFFKRE
jgi:hypothetical protein